MALLKRSGSKSQRDPEGRMPLMEHLRELRNRLLIAFAAVAVGLIVGWIVFPPVWELLKEPYCSTVQSRQLTGSCSLTYNGIFSSFFITLKVSLMVGLVVASPVWLHQIWSFVTPALYRSEKRYSLAFLGLAIPLFVLGALVSYFIMDTALGFLLSFSLEDTVATISIDDYLNYVLIMLVIFGVSFELPLLLAFLNVIGVLSHATVAKHRRLVIFLMFVFGAIVTPGGDPLTMMALAAPMIVLFLAAELFMFVREKRRPASEFGDLSDDEASPLEEPSPEEDADPTDRR
ncbi:twin-arginine translocase subunit TatC [Nonomuraea phyllanthi]|uniref:Sec-independent protein translocase protein TatC n=1 Tax=Nonomuraea phyllanthi TaxID=2219224 RepID=A0A5C4WQE6_9ACTN|nr:twin-arginine translocase subunit TatC [Nonomuraea phyllanthi]KAB8195239.1 twin-arginine translocase subunit TatC [Nonomuraea phyllanthi]QFY10630.1 twin-arginine translocase subunit TatC [Nonomuraea phyllanthi]